MKQTRWISTISVFILMTAVSSFSQDRYTWRTATDIQEGVRGNIAGTVTDVDEARSQLQVATDDNSSSVAVLTDSVSTQYNGFGGVINGQPEIYTGTQGFSNIREGDRVEIRGSGTSNNAIRADFVILLGRPIAASQVGVGQTRQPTSISTPTAVSTTATTDSNGPVEGIVRQVSAADYRITIETDRRAMVTVRANGSTPVYYRGNAYQLRNLEPGDRIRVDADASSTTNGEVSARSIEVTRSAQEAGSATNGRSVAEIEGRVSRIDRSGNMVRLDTGRGVQPIDLSNAADSEGHRVRAADFQVGDVVTVAGSQSGSGTNVFLASTVRWTQEAPAPNDAPAGPDDAGSADYGADTRTTEYALVTVYGSVTESLANSPQLVVREAQTNRVVRILVSDDFIVRAKGGTYTTAEQLKSGDSITAKAYRDGAGNYVAQTIRVR